MRECYELSDETIAVFEGRRDEIAKEWGKNRSTVDSIMSGRASDPFAMLKSIFPAAVRAGAPVERWLNWLNAVVAQYANKERRGTRSMAELLCEKLASDVATDSEMVRAFADGRVTKTEATRILAFVDKEQELLDEIRRIVNEKREL